MIFSLRSLLYAVALRCSGIKGNENIVMVSLPARSGRSGRIHQTKEIDKIFTDELEPLLKMSQNNAH